MTVLARMSASGMTEESYDESAKLLTDRLRAAPGFVFHVAFVTDGEFHVSEIWESRETYDNWFSDNVKPHVPGVKMDLVTEVHNVIKK